jgi:type II secretory pathway pseudopilin PulG
MRLPTLVFTKTFGFTLIELLVSVSLIMIMTAAIVPSFTTYTKNQNKLQAAEFVKSELRTVQNKALTGVNSDQANAGFWAVKFFNDSTGSSSVRPNQLRYYVTASNDSSTCDNLDNTDPYIAASVIPSSIFVKNTSMADTSCLFFSFEDGSVVGTTAFSAGRIDLGYNADTTATQYKRVYFSREGAIYVN